MYAPALTLAPPRSLGDDTGGSVWPWLLLAAAGAGVYYWLSGAAPSSRSARSALGGIWIGKKRYPIEAEAGGLFRYVDARGENVKSRSQLTQRSDGDWELKGRR